jgi:hypothetical protein
MREKLGNMLRARILRSLGLYIVNKDPEVFWLDVDVAGLQKLRHPEKYKGYFLTLKRWLSEYTLVDPDEALEEAVFVYSRGEGEGKTIVLMFYSMRRGKVYKVVLAPLKPGVLKTLDGLLEMAGWRRKFLLDMKPARHLSLTT